MAAAANTQIMQIRDTVRRMQEDFNALGPGMDRRLNTLTDDLFDDHNRQFGNVKTHLDTIQQNLATLNNHLITSHTILETISDRTVTINQILDVHVEALLQQPNPIGTGLMAINGSLNRVVEQLTLILRRFDALESQLRTDKSQTARYLELLNQQLAPLNRLPNILDELLSSLDRHADQRLISVISHLDAMADQITSIDFRAALNQQLTEQSNVFEGHFHRLREATNHQIEELRMELRRGKKSGRKPPKVIKVCCVIM